MTNTINTQSNALLFIPMQKPNAILRLVCFSYAGGTSDIYLPWIESLNEDTELVLCQLPGRSNRLAEESYQTIEPLIADLVAEITPLSNKPLVFFGHSMGSKIAYELLVMMRSKHLPTPVHFIVSACGAPFLPRRRPAINKLPDALFIIALSRLNGTPLSVLNNAEVMRLFIPSLRADFSIIENYINQEKSPLNTALTIFGGTEDTIIEKDDLLAWKTLVSSSVKTEINIDWIIGDHFYIRNNSAMVITRICNILAIECSNQRLYA